jgi:hypothetical protein
MSETPDLKRRMISFGSDLESVLVELYCAANDISAGRLHISRATKTIERASAASALLDSLIGQSLQIQSDPEIADLVVQFLTSYKPRLSGHMAQLKSVLQTASNAEATSSDEDEEAAELLRAVTDAAQSPAPEGEDSGSVGDDIDPPDNEIPYVLRQEGIVESPFGFVIASPQREFCESAENGEIEEDSDSDAETRAERREAIARLNSFVPPL